MRERWMPAGIMAGGLFVVNMVMRLIVRLVAGSDTDQQTWIGAAAIVLVSAGALVVAVRWARRFPMPRVAGDLTIAICAGSLLSALVGPFISRGEAFGGGFGHFLTQLVLYLGICGAGALFGVLGAMVAGADHKSQSWKRYAETMRTGPRRI